MKRGKPSSPHGLWFGLAERKREIADLTVVGIPFDGAVSYRKGAAGGPDRIRRISREIPPVLETGERLEGLSVRDIGNLKLPAATERAFSRLEPTLRKWAGRSFLLTLGGDHSVAIPVHRALSSQATEPIGIVFVDAHTDLSDQFNGSRFSHACPLRRALELPGYDPRRTVLVGTRCYEEAGLEFIKKNEIAVYPAHRIAEEGMARIAQEVVDRLKSVPNIYLSIDIDALDPAFAPGTGIPDAGGLSTRDVLTLVRKMADLSLVAADLVEVAPSLDRSDITGFAAIKILTEIFGAVWRRKVRGQRIRLL